MFAWIFTILGWLGKLPGISWIVGWFTKKWPSVKEKHRLIIEYALIGIIITAATLAVTLWFQRERVEKRLDDAQTKIGSLQTRVNTVEFVNEQQSLTINQLEKLRELDQKSLSGLNEDYQGLSARDAAMRQRLQELEKQNAEVREYLDRPLPPELRRLLEDR